MSDSRGDDAKIPIPAYPGQDRPADAGAEDMSQPDPPDDAALPSEMAGLEDNAGADDVTQRTPGTDR